ncbi:MAG: alpha/beta fold hydrolase [Alphaproteobacteria bacterium]|nr:alpha/beta fold hydrolase [Alphaproteobacteria bacterium]
MLEEVTLKPTNGGASQHAVIILHGLGDSAEGIMGLGEAMCKAFPDTEFLAPNAPYPCDFSPFGYQWFSMQDMSPAAILKGVINAATTLNAYIDHVLETRKLSPDKVALLGFSQGTMMSLYVAPRREKALAAVLGYSGALIGGELLPQERKSAPPVMLIHGTHDDVVPFSAMDQAIAGLHNVNINASSLACPGLGHSVNDLGLTQGVQFLRRIFQV